MKPRLLIAVIACALAAPAFAQEPDARRERQLLVNGQDIRAQVADAKATALAWRQWGDALRASLGTMFGDHFASAKVVKGAPYSAEISTEVTRTLADGNVIARKTTGRVYRDGEGRTRQETVVDGEAKSIQLRDPVEGTAVMLLPGSRKAVRMPSFAWHHDGKPAGHREGGDKVIVKRIDRDDGGDGDKRDEVRVQVLRGADGVKSIDLALAVPPIPPMPPMHALHDFGPLSSPVDGLLPRRKGTTTSLGEKAFDGVRAEGKSIVRTIPAGEIGNRNPIMVTSESWYSPELKVTVYSRHSDPRSDETVYRLTQIRRGEPDPGLFKVPEDYAAAGRERR